MSDSSISEVTSDDSCDIKFVQVAPVKQEASLQIHDISVHSSDILSPKQCPENEHKDSAVLMVNHKTDKANENRAPKTKFDKKRQFFNKRTIWRKYRKERH